METWKDLADAIMRLSPEQQSQPIQCAQVGAEESKAVECIQGIALDTVGNFQFFACRSTHDNKYHAADVVMLLDGNPFAEDGATAYEWDGSDDWRPIYGKGGPTDPKDHQAPNGKELIDTWKHGLTGHRIHAINSRLKDA